MHPMKEYRIKQGEVFPLKVLCQGHSEFKFFSESHWHEYMEIIYVVKGHTQAVLNGKKIELNANDVVLIGKDTIHSTKDLSEGNSLCFIVFFYPELINSAFSSSNELNYINKFLNCFENGNDYKFVGNNEDNKELSDLLFKMYTAYENKGLGYELDLKGHFYQIVANMIKNSYFSVADKIMNEASMEQFEEVLSYINKHYMESIDLALVANKMDLSYHYFSKLFKQVVGKSFKQYLDYIRVAQAEKLILDKNVSITDAALEVGIADATCFSRMYKRIRGYSPNYFKKHIKKERLI